MRTLIGMFLIFASIGFGIWGFLSIVPDFADEETMYWFVASAVVFISAAGVLVGALFIERDVTT